MNIQENVAVETDCYQRKGKRPKARHASPSVWAVQSSSFIKMSTHLVSSVLNEKGHEAVY